MCGTQTQESFFKAYKVENLEQNEPTPPSLSAKKQQNEPTPLES